MEPPSPFPSLGDDHSDEDAICERCRRVSSSPWVGWQHTTYPKQVRGASGRK